MSGAEDQSAGAYGVVVDKGEHGWEVRIVDGLGRVVSSRACGDEAEARAFASTVQQHRYWLSPATFRKYYRLPDTVEG